MIAKLGFLLLSGGKSQRMGSHKALLKVDGSTMLHTIAKAGEDFAERILSANAPEIPTPEGFIRCEDVYPGCGPMAGIHAALLMTDCDALVVAPCDAPHYSKDLAQYLAQQYSEDLDVLVFVDDDGRTHPLCGVYSKRCLPVLEENLKSGKFKIMWMLESMRLRKLTLPEHFSAECLIISIRRRILRRIGIRKHNKHSERGGGNFLRRALFLAVSC